MSLTSLPNAATESAPYQHLLPLHEANASGCDQETLDGLSEKFRKQIFFDSSKRAREPDEADYEKRHVFDHLSEPQQAVKRVAFVASSSLKTRAKDREDVREDRNRKEQDRKEQDRKEQDAVDSFSALLRQMSFSLSDPNYRLLTILKDWVGQTKSRENRIKAAYRIRNFLKNVKEEYLVLSCLGLQSLPDLFDKEPFISRPIHLTLSNNKLESLPSGICQLQYLKSLTLSGKGLKSLPNEIGQLRCLKSLTFSGNGLKSLPDGICQLQLLNWLSLSNNKLESLPNGISRLQNLKSLILSGNGFTSFPNEICELQSLEFLNLSDNRLELLPDGICWLQQLKVLQLAHNSLRLIPLGISQLRKLTFLGLSDNFTLEGPLNILLPLPRDCTVDIRCTNLSKDALSDLQGAYNRQDYQGPRIFFPVTNPPPPKKTFRRSLQSPRLSRIRGPFL